MSLVKELYNFITFAITPFLPILLKKRVKKGKEVAARYQEKMGLYNHAKLPSNRQVIWIHCASVGETKLMAFVVEFLLKKGEQVLLTTGTKTSAEIAEKSFANNKNFHHCFAVLDSNKYVDRFLEVWKPKFAIWAESEIWPNTLTKATNKFEVYLLNARMGNKSYKNWQKVRGFAKHCLQKFSVIYTQGDKQKELFESFGLDNVIAMENLKYAVVNKSDYNANKLENTWLAVSTHAGEEDLCIAAHNKVKEHIDNLKTIIIPRHPNRDLKSKYNSLNNIVFLSDNTSYDISKAKSDVILVVDFIGIAERYMQLTDIVLVGGSLVAHGGHNPIEPAINNCTILLGKHMFNFPQIEEDFLFSKAAVSVDEQDLADKIQWLLLDSKARNAYAKNALNLVKDKSKVRNDIIQIIEDKLQRLEGNVN